MLRLHIVLVIAAAFGPSIRAFCPESIPSPDRSSLTQCAASSRRDVLGTAVTGAAAVLAGLSQPAQARLEAVNNPSLLPSEQGLNVIQTEKFLTSGQAKRLDKLLGALERDTGWRVRVLCQSYPYVNVYFSVVAVFLFPLATHNFVLFS